MGGIGVGGIAAAAPRGLTGREIVVPRPDAAPEAGPAAPLVPLPLLGAVGFAVTADARVIDPLLPALAADFGTDIAAAALAVSAYTLPYGLFQLVYGPLGDRLGKTRVMAAALLFFAVGTAACGLAPGLGPLVALRFLTGVAAAAVIPLSLAAIGDGYPYAERQAALGRYLTALALGQILGTSLGGSVADFVSWRVVFGLYGIVAVGLAAVFWRATRGFAAPLPRSAPGAGLAGYVAPYRGLLADQAVRLVVGTVFLEGFFFFGGFVYFGASLRERFGLAYAAIGAILAGFGIGGLVYGRAVRRLLPRLGERGLVRLGGGLVGAGFLGAALLPAWQPAVPLVPVLGFGFYALHGTLQTRATELAPTARGTAVSLFAFCLFVGQALGAAALGRVVDALGYAPTFLLSGVAVALLAGRFAGLLRPQPTATDPAPAAGPG